MRKASRFLIFTFTLCAVAIFTTTIVRAFFYSPDTDIPVPADKQLETSPLQHPARLIVPALDIDADVQEVGINAQGNMGVPSNFTDVAWYKYGVVPGGPGSAVMAGHVDNGLGLSGVFKKLGELEAGDEVIIERQDGKMLTFVVTGKRSYPYDAVPTDIVFNPSGSIRLNLITCEGAWVKSEKTYDQRLVIFTKLKGT
jgi:sortase A